MRVQKRLKDINIAHPDLQKTLAQILLSDFQIH